MKSNPQNPSTWWWIEEGQSKQTWGPQPTTLPWKHRCSTSLLRCAYKRLWSPSHSPSPAEIGAEEDTYCYSSFLSTLNWGVGHARPLGGKISRLKHPWTTSIYRLHLCILISIPLPPCMHREVQSIHSCTLAQGWHKSTGSEAPCVAEVPRQRGGRGSEHCPPMK